MTEKNLAYQEALDYLYSFVDYSLTRGFRFSPEKFDLGRMVTFLELLGNPHRSYPVIHVAGTKGKGSTAALIASALQAAGYRVGFYTSPHLQEYTERIQVNGQPVTEAGLVDLVEYVKPYVSDVEQLTTFEITTAIGFLYFAREKVDVTVAEVGLGGRLDATNVVDPLLSVITSLSLDHMNVLGDTLEKIAFEKAGIIKPGRPVVSAIQKPEALQVIEQVSAERGCPLVVVGRDTHYTSGTHSLDGQSLEVWNNQGRRAHLTIPLLGQHQVENAATAFTALQVAAEKGLIISDEPLRRGFASVRWPGRFEVLRKEPLLIVDSAHNRDSALRLRQALDDYLPGRPVVLLFGASEDKDIEGMFAELMPRVQCVVATQSIHPRAMEAAKLVELAGRFGRPAEAVVPLEKALAAALKQAGTGAAVVAAGSLFIAAAVRETWRKMENQPV
jgi:dihydrofolate synthase/folylpolyglutamate synthase